MTRFEWVQLVLETMGRTFTVLMLVLYGAIGIGRAQGNVRARDLGIPFDGTTGTFNAITDVKGVEVGNTTLIVGT